MKLVVSFLVMILLAKVSPAAAQKVDSIYFHLYTDSLKKGRYNYINVDGKLSNGRYLPLDNRQVTFSCNTGKWDGNSLVIDSSYSKDSVVVTATLKDQPSIQKAITIYLKKKPEDEALKTEKEIFEEVKKNRKKKG